MPPYSGNPNDHPTSEFTKGMSSTCLCTSITVTIHDSALFSSTPRGHLCYCSNCRKVAGSYVSSNLLLSAESVQIKDRDGTLRTFADYDTGSGKAVMRSFCSRDGNPVKSESDHFPGKVILKTGMFPRLPKPEMEVFAGHRPDWLPRIEGVVMFETGGDSGRIDKQ